MLASLESVKVSSVWKTSNSVEVVPCFMAELRGCPDSTVKVVPLIVMVSVL